MLFALARFKPVHLQPMVEQSSLTLEGLFLFPLAEEEKATA